MKPKILFLIACVFPQNDCVAGTASVSVCNSQCSSHLFTGQLINSPTFYLHREVIFSLVLVLAEIVSAKKKKKCENEKIPPFCSRLEKRDAL